MRHRNAGWKLGRNTSHRRALLRNLVTSLIVEERMVTTVAKAKALRPWAEKMITLGKAETLHARRQAGAFLKTPASIKKVFDALSARFMGRRVYVGAAIVGITALRPGARTGWVWNHWKNIVLADPARRPERSSWS